MFKPFFLVKDWSLDITMKEFYDITKKELHFFSLELNEFCIKDISYKTMPELPVLTAMQMSSALPGIIAPVFIEGKCYLDGGVLCNYPLKNCLDVVANPEEIFAINNFYVKQNDNKIKEDSTILEYIVNLITSMIFTVGVKYLPEPNSINNELVFEVSPISFEELKNSVYEQKTREELYQVGVEGAKLYFNKKTISPDIVVSEENIKPESESDTVLELV
jgi:predicted acylesterase/phospholipase RssA